MIGLVAEAMSTEFQQVYDDDPLTKALGTFAETGVNTIVVVERTTGSLYGVISKKIMLKPRLNPTNVLVRTFSIKPPMIRPDDDLAEAAKLMLGSDLKAAPVVSEGKPVGMLHASSIVKKAAAHVGRVRVADVMTREPVVMSASETVGKAVSLMRDYGISRVPVVEGGRLVGIVTVHDILEKIVKPREKVSKGDLVGEKVATLGNQVSSIMTKQVHTISQNEKLVRAIEKMDDLGITSLVVTERGRVVGIITLMDALEPIAALASKAQATLNVQVSYKLPSIDIEDKDRVMDVVNQFVKRFGSSVGTGNLSLYFKAHKEKHGDMHLIHCRARLNTDKYQFVGLGEAWRADFAARTALERIERQFLVRRELAARYPYADEILDRLAESF
ncbi:MAG: CBS domain-containing protein [Nitrososphaerota archaeon]